jgi:signal transduction histidine kinase
MGQAPSKIESESGKTQPARTDADLRHEIEERTLAESALRQLSQRIVQLQDEERRRIARELHDSIGQQLTAISILIDTPGQTRPIFLSSMKAKC